MKSALFELPAEGRDDFGAGDEGLADIGIGDQVQIALAVPGLDVLQAVPLLRHGEQDLGKEVELLGVDAQFAGAGAEQIAFGADDVAEIDQRPKLVVRAPETASFLT